MRKIKYLIPIISTTIASSALIPTMVSCNKGEETATINCEGFRTNTVTEAGQTFTFVCKYTGVIKEDYETTEGQLPIVIKAFYLVDGKEHACKYVNLIPSEYSNPQGFAIADKDGNFKLTLFAWQIPEDKQPIDFYLKFYVVNDNIIETYNLDGFRFIYS